MGGARREGERSVRAPQIPQGEVSGHMGQVLGGSRATMNQISQLTGRKEMTLATSMGAEYFWATCSLPFPALLVSKPPPHLCFLKQEWVFC